jgi:hypothetical protein
MVMESEGASPIPHPSPLQLQPLHHHPSTPDEMPMKTFMVVGLPSSYATLYKANKYDRHATK